MANKNKNENPVNSSDTVEKKNSRSQNHQGYVGGSISLKQLKRLMVNSTPEARGVLKSVVLDDFKVRQDAKGTMGWAKTDVKRKVK